MMGRLLPALGFLVSCACASLHADTLVLKNGQQIQGRLEGVGGEIVYLRLPRGKIGYHRDEIQEIKIDSQEDNAAALSARLGPAAAGPGTPQERLSAPSKLPAPQQDAVNQLLNTLRALNDEEEDSGFNEHRQRVVDALAEAGEAGAPLIYQAFMASDVETAPYLIAALAKAAPADGGAVAREAVRQHPLSDVRAMAVRALAENPQENAEALAEALGDEQGHVRLAAIEGMTVSKDPAFVPALKEVLEKDLPHLREAALVAVNTCSGNSFETPEDALKWLEERLKP